MPSPGLLKRIERFWEAIEKLRKIASHSVEEIISNFLLYDSAERNLHIALEVLFDVGNFIISALNVSSPRSYADIAMKLCRIGVISLEEADMMKKMAGLRNILVHGYVNVSPLKICEIIKNRLDDLIHMMNKMLSFIKKKNIDP